jgi:hypothetical protein
MHSKIEGSLAIFKLNYLHSLQIGYLLEIKYYKMKGCVKILTIYNRRYKNQYKLRVWGTFNKVDLRFNQYLTVVDVVLQ